MQSLEQLLQQLNDRLNSRELRLNSQRVCRFTINKDVTVSIEEGRPADHFHLYSIVISLADTGLVALYARLLEAQLFNAKLGEGMSFGLDTNSAEILLQQRLSLRDMDEEDFYHQLSLFISWATYWKKELTGSAENTSSSTDSPFGVDHFIRA